MDSAWIWNLCNPSK